ncbi:MAG: gliding motility protein GldL [Sphingobacteriales bacterium]|nr:gliding motility protein GldL [Sphingobacteriales bacterium]
MAKAKSKPSKKKGSFLQSHAFKAFMAKLYGWGASVVILGALFKIQHWKGAGIMLTLGLSTEALIFFLSAFDIQKEYDWTKVYPELAVTDEHEEGESTAKKSISGEIEKMLEEAKIETTLVRRLGEGMNKLANTVDGLKEVGNAAVLTSEYAGKLQVASASLDKINESYGKAAEAMTLLSEASASSKEYFDQIKLATSNLTALNSVYELELNEQSKHKEIMSQYQDKLGEVLSNLSDVGSISVQIKDGFSKLNENLTGLNNIYGNMLSAMTYRG